MLNTSACWNVFNGIVFFKPIILKISGDANNNVPDGRQFFEQANPKSMI